MNPITPKKLLAVLAASAAGLVSAQALAPAADIPASGVVLAEQPRASIATGARGPHVEAANAIVQALAADASMRGSKVTVTPEENTILLTGVTPTLRQLGRVVQIASQHAGEAKLINGLNTEEVFIEPNPSGAAQPAESAPAQG